MVHNEVVKSFCREATKQNISDPELHKKYMILLMMKLISRWRIPGLKALEALCETKYFIDGSNMDSSTHLVLKSILGNIDYTASALNHPDKAAPK